MHRLASFIRQCAAVSRYNMETLWSRRGTSAVAVFGVAGVVGVMVAVLSMAAGFRSVIAGQARDDIVVVLRSGALNETGSVLGNDEVQALTDVPGIARGPSGALVAPELFVVIDREQIGGGTVANVPLRGVSPESFEVRGRIDIVSGRNFDPGRNEVIVGVAAAATFEGLAVGDRIPVGRAEWHVVGHFTAEGAVAESEVWTDTRVLQQSYQRGNSYNLALVRLPDAGDFEAFRRAVEADPRLNVSVRTERTYQAAQSRTMETFISVLGWIIVAMMTAGAVFAALNTNYAAVSARAREVATLRALGFLRLPVVVSVMIESFVLAVVGAVIGGAASWALFDGFRASTLNFASFSQVIFNFDVTPRLLAQGISLSLVIGAFGGLLPAIAAARRSVIGALREQ